MSNVPEHPDDNAPPTLQYETPPSGRVGRRWAFARSIRTLPNICCVCLGYCTLRLKERTKFDYVEVPVCKDCRDWCKRRQHRFILTTAPIFAAFGFALMAIGWIRGGPMSAVAIVSWVLGILGISVAAPAMIAHVCQGPIMLVPLVFWDAMVRFSNKDYLAVVQADRIHAVRRHPTTPEEGAAAGLAVDPSKRIIRRRPTSVEGRADDSQPRS